LWQKLKEIIAQKLHALNEEEAVLTQTRQLQDAYRANYPDDEQLSADDPGTQSARELMRLRLMQDPNLVKQEFDDVIKPHLRINGVADWLDLEPAETFDADWQKISEIMAQPSEKELVSDCIYLIIRKSRGAGLGPDCYGFAHDPKTKSTAINNAYGLHAYVWYYLRNLIIGLNDISKIIGLYDSDENDRQIESRFIHGTIYKTNITQTPILLIRSHLTEAEKEEFWQWARDQRRFIPIDKNDFDR